jgi:hypothetical protein
MSTYEVRPLRLDEIDYAATLAARAFRDQPTLLQISEDPIKRMRFFYKTYRAALPVLPRLPISAWHNGHLAGLVGIQYPGECQLNWNAVLRVLPHSAFASTKGTRVLLESMRSRDEHDLDEPHIHLEPCAVDPLAQARYVGRDLFQYLTRMADKDGLPLFGIGDKAANEHYFSRYGFEVVERFDILGMPHLSMRREIGVPFPELSGDHGDGAPR